MTDKLSFDDRLKVLIEMAKLIADEVSDTYYPDDDHIEEFIIAMLDKHRKDFNKIKEITDEDFNTAIENNMMYYKKGFEYGYKRALVSILAFIEDMEDPEYRDEILQSVTLMEMSGKCEA